MEDSVISKLIKQEKQLLDRVDSLEILIDLIDDEFVEVGSSAAIYDKAEVIRWLSSESRSESEGTSFKAHPLSKEMILLTYTSSIKDKSTSVTKQAIRSSIWRLTEDRWRMIFHQGTPLP